MAVPKAACVPPPTPPEPSRADRLRAFAARVERFVDDQLKGGARVVPFSALPKADLQPPVTADETKALLNELYYRYRAGGWEVSEVHVELPRDADWKPVVFGRGWRFS